MAQLSVSGLSHALKRLYPEDELKKMMYEESPFFAMMRKRYDFYGEERRVTVIHGPGAGRARTIANAQTGYTPHKGVKFDITRVQDYAIAELTGEVIEASENDKGAIVRALKQESDAAHIRLKRSLSHNVWRDGAGDIGQIATGGISGTTLTLSNPEDIVHIEVGDVLTANPTRTGSSGTMRAGNMVVQTVDRDAGTFTVDATATGLAAADYLYKLGDYDGCLKGFLAWVSPDASPGTLFGTTRTTDRVRLAGVRYDAADGEPLVEVIQGTLMRITRESKDAKPKYVFGNPTKGLQLQKELGGKVEYVNVKSDDGVVGFEGIVVQTGKGKVTFIEDPNVPVNRLAVVDMRSWCFHALKGPIPRVLNLDGNEMLRKSTDDAYELRWGYRGQIGCDSPGYNGVAILD